MVDDIDEFGQPHQAPCREHLRRPCARQPVRAQGNRLCQQDPFEEITARHHLARNQTLRYSPLGPVPRRHQEPRLLHGIQGRSVVQPRRRTHPCRKRSSYVPKATSRCRKSSTTMQWASSPTTNATTRSSISGHTSTHVSPTSS